MEQPNLTPAKLPVFTPARPTRIVSGLKLAVLAALVAAYVYVLLGIWAIIRPFIPDELSATLFQKTITVHHVQQKIGDNALLLVLLLPAVFAVEALTIGWQKSSIRRILFDRSETIKMDIAYVLAGQAQITTLISKILTFGIAVGFGATINAGIGHLFHIDFSLSALPYWGQVFVYFWAATFFDYWTHRLDHTHMFWPLHRFHHSTTDFCVITALRSHPANFTGLFLINLPMAILGAPVDVMISINLMVTIIGLLIHSSIDSNWGWFGRWIIQSPNHHRLHHIKDYRKNGVGHYSMAPVWDHLFGTWKGECDQTLPIGVDEPYRFGYWFMPDLIRDYVNVWKTAPRGIYRKIRYWNVNA